MGASDLVRRGRARAESIMSDTVIVRRYGPKTLNEATGLHERPSTIVYGAPVAGGLPGARARIKIPTATPRDVDAQAQQLTSQEPRVDLPVKGSEGVATGDIVEVLASETDPANVGKTLRISGDFIQTLATARRFPAEVITSG